MFDFLKKKVKVIDVKVEDGKGITDRRKKWIVPAIAVAICVLALVNPGSEKKEEKTSRQKIDQGEQTDDYVKEAEERLAHILSGVKGAGSVSVMMNFDMRGEKILAKNTVDSMETRMTQQGTESNSSDSEDVLLCDSGGSQQPYVVKEKLPAPSGVLVVATGASDQSVRLEMYEAVKALYGISGHRIKVAASSK